MRVLTWVLKRYRPLAAAAVALVVAVPVLVVTVGAGAPDGVTLDGVSPDNLAKFGITLTAPQPGDRPLVTAEAALAVAQFHGLPVRQVVLARLSDDHRVPPLKDRLAWVFSFDVTNSVLPPLPEPLPEGLVLRWSYRVAAVDAETGQLLESMGAGGPDPGQPAPSALAP